MNRIFWKAAGAFALGLASLQSAQAASTFYYDDFERPDSSQIGPGWVVNKGGWELADGTARGTLSGDYAQAVYTGLNTGQQPYVAQIDATTTAQGRWVGFMFNVDPENHGNFYVFVVRGAGSNPSAAQFRRYVDGVRDVRNDVTGIFEPETLARHDYFRYRVVSQEPGVFDLSILRLDQETREPVEVLWEQRVEDELLPNWGGHAGLYGNQDFRIDDILVASHDQPQAPELAIEPAVEVEFLAEHDRLYQAQVLEGDEWVNHGGMIHGRGEIVSVRLPRADREEVRVVSGAE